tara:strand:- start:649 stop:2145 length:1497 start_codon:yes stop_codon:yes gene_type:complete
MTSLDLPARDPRPLAGFNPLRLRELWLGMDSNGRVLQWVQSRTGIAVLHAAFLLFMALLPVVRTKHLAIIAVALVLSALLPGRRALVLAGVGGLYFLLRPFKSEVHYQYFGEIWREAGVLTGSAQAGMVLCGAGFVAVVLLLIENQRRRHLTVLAERPVVSLLVAGVALTAVTLMVPRGDALFTLAWLAVAYVSATFFFIGYILMGVRQKPALANTTLLGYVRPVWAESIVPIKGPGYLSKFEAHDAEAIAMTRLKGLKLVVWAVILFWGGDLVFGEIVHARLGLPTFEPLIVSVAAGEVHSVALNWLVVAVHFLEKVLKVGASVHAFVAVVRMAGFAIPRGMVRPLASRTISEYWGRYLFYFKELLSDFFFFPTFQRCFKKHPRLRIAFATFMAAFVGNILFDVISKAPDFGFEGWAATIENFQSYTVYAGALTLGIIWSQLYQAQPRPEDGVFRYHVAPRVVVLGFFAVLQIFDDSSGVVPFSDRFTFFVSLFGVN